MLESSGSKYQNTMVKCNPVPPSLNATSKHTVAPPTHVGGGGGRISLATLSKVIYIFSCSIFRYSHATINNNGVTRTLYME